MIFINLKKEDKIQVGDKTRLDVSGTFITSGTGATITLIEIDPDNTATFFDVTSNQYLDWVYALDGDQTINVRVTDSDTNVENKSFTLSAISVADDNLFSKDEDLVASEGDIYLYLREGRTTFLDKHREAQQRILGELDRSGMVKRDGGRYEPSDITEIEEFRIWSKYLTLQIIFEANSNDINDIFFEKSSRYRTLANETKSRAFIRLDSDGDGELEQREVFSGYMVRR